MHALTSQLLSIIRLLFGLLFGCHLFACLWGLQASFDHLATWTGEKGFCTEWTIEEPCPNGRSCSEITNTSCADAGTLWLYSFYFSLATVTSIGYGDISATDTNHTEQIVCIVIMLIGALTFSYLIGNFCALASALSPDLAQFRFDLSDLNKLMSREIVPDEMRYRLREYMHNTDHLRQAKIRQDLFGALSPVLLTRTSASTPTPTCAWGRATTWS